MDRCSTCKHWQQEPEYVYELKRDVLGGVSAQGTHSEKWGQCVVAKGSNGKAIVPETLVFAEDASSYSASMSTHRDFGCVLHESA